MPSERGSFLCGGFGFCAFAGDDGFAGVNGVFDAFVEFEEAVAEAEDALAVASDVFFVGHDDDGFSGAIEVLEEGHDLFAGFGIEVAGGFVAEDHDGVGDDGAGDGDALLLTAREFVWFMVHAAFETDFFEGLFGEGGPVFGAGVHEWEFDVLEGGGAREEVVVLEDEADVLVANVGELIFVEAADLFFVEVVLAGGGLVEASEDVHEGRFSGAGWPHDGDELALMNDDVYALEGLDRHLAHDVVLAQIADFDDFFHSCRRASMGWSLLARMAG